MTTCFLAPDPIQSTQFIPGGAVPATGGQLFFYAAGSATKQTVYKDNAAAVAWSNPIVLDSGGNLPLGGVVWFPTGQTFQVVFAPSNDTDPPASPYWSKDNLSGINDVTVSAASEWISGPTPTFISATSFSVLGDQTLTFTVGRRLKSTNSGGTIYSSVMNATFGVGVTTISVTNDSGALDSGLSAVFYALADPANPSISPVEIYRKGAAVASAGNATTNIWGSNGDYLHVTGTNSIRHFSTAPYAGAFKTVVFDSVLTLFTSASFAINGNQNVTTAANDRARVRADTVSTYVIDFNSQAVPSPFGAQSSGAVFVGPSTGSATPTFRTLVGAESGLTLIASSTNIANASTMQFTGLSSVYDVFVIEGVNIIPTSTGAIPMFTLSNDNGASYEVAASSYQNAVKTFITDGSTSDAFSTADTKIVVANTGVSSSNAGGGLSFVTRFAGMGSSSHNKQTHSHGVQANSASQTFLDFFSVGIGVSPKLTTSATNAIKFSFSVGSTASGSMYLYGVRPS